MINYDGYGFVLYSVWRVPPLAPAPSNYIQPHPIPGAPVFAGGGGGGGGQNVSLLLREYASTIGYIIEPVL